MNVPVDALAALQAFQAVGSWEQRARMLMQWGERLPALADADRSTPIWYKAVKAWCGWWGDCTTAIGSLLPAAKRA